jgi:hypothetical protein
MTECCLWLHVLSNANAERVIPNLHNLISGAKRAGIAGPPPDLNG